MQVTRASARNSSTVVKREVQDDMMVQVKAQVVTLSAAAPANFSIFLEPLQPDLATSM
jgi:hypothetical protein